MVRRIVVYGYGDERPGLGFPSPDHLKEYIKQVVFTMEGGRHRYTQRRDVDVIVLSRKGLAYGYFEVQGKTDPNAQDREEYPPTKQVYFISGSALYTNPVKMSQVQIRVNQFGVEISEEKFQEINRLAGAIEKYGP
jgi:hypothetical protein